MKKFILFSLLIVCTNLLFAQTNGGNNNNGQTPPTYQNPFGKNPYGTNPFSNGQQNQDNNIFKDTENKKVDDKKSDNNQSDNNQTDNNSNNPPDKDKVVDFGDRNTNNQNGEGNEDYKNDPDYQKYIEEQKKGETEISTYSVPDIDPSIQVYGANFLSSSSSNYSSSSLTSVPEDYRLGVGDEIVVSVWGASEFQSPFTISKDGSIFPNQVGKIFLQGLSFQAARSVIAARFKRVLPSGSNVDIVLGKVRTVRVYIYGEVNRPGMITMSALNTPISALQRAGGLNKFGNLRDIQIRRNGITIEHIDIYEYLKNGNFGRETYLEDNDIISVRLYDKIVQAQGAFKRPMKYQLGQYGTLTDLIDLAGGARFDARESLIRVKTVANEQERFQDFNGQDLLSIDYVLKDGDVVNINTINSGVSNTVSIQGAVPYPDNYQIVEGDRVFKIIEKAGGLNPNSYKPRAYIYRNGATTEDSKALKINLKDYGESDISADNILLQNGDIVKILSESQFDERFYINVKGLVRMPGNKNYKPNLVLKDALLLAGGLELAAEGGRIEISNVTDTFSRYSITGNTINVRMVAISPNLEIDEISEKIRLKPYDIIYVRRKKDISEQKNIYIYGEVDYPGEYALLSNKETLTSMLIRTGGLKKAAFPEGAKLFRSSIGQVVIDLKDAMRNAGGKDDIVLEDGDKIIIPRKEDVVRISGEVQNPINIKYDSEKNNVMSYIDASGGFGERPWRKRISVKYQNGKFKRTKNFMFFKFYPKVRPGSTVTVPRRPENKVNFDFKDVFQYSMTAVTSVLTILLISRNL